jgi:hypothetical protein
MGRLFKIVPILIGTFLFAAAPAYAQFTTVSGTVQDPNGIPYASGTITAILTPATPGGYRLQGQPYSGSLPLSNLDATGSFTLSMGDNGQITPAGSQWTFTVCSNPGGIEPPLGTGNQCFQITVTITGGSQSISSQLQAAAPKLTTLLGSGGGVSGLTTGFIPEAKSATSLQNSPCDDGITTASTLTCAEALNVTGQVSATGGFFATSDGVHAGQDGLFCNTTAPATISNGIGFIGALAASCTPYWMALPSAGPSATSVMTFGALSSAVSTVSFAGVQGTDANFLTSGTVSGTGASLCTDAQGGATTSGCPSNPASVVLVPGTTAANTIAPTANGVIGLTVLETTGTGTPNGFQVCSNSAGACGTVHFRTDPFGNALAINFNASGGVIAGASFNLGAGQIQVMSATAPTIAASGCGTAGASVTENNGTSAFRINIGTTNSGTCTITMPSQTGGWNCHATNRTTKNTNQATVLPTSASNSTTLVLQNYTDVMGTHAMTDSDILEVTCTGD